KGRSSFQALQNALSATDTSETLYYAFDLPYLNGYDLRRVVLEERKALLKHLIPEPGILRYSEHFHVDGAKFIAQVCSLGLEGLIQAAPAFVNPPQGAEARRAHWVKPELVAQVTFTEWTHDAIVRNASFQGLRDDKRARDVVREESGRLPKLSPRESKLNEA